MHHMVTAARRDRLSFFDRGIIDQVSGLEHLKLPIAAHLSAAVRRFRYHGKVFMMPPWPEIFVPDRERTQTTDWARRCHDVLVETYPNFGYELVELPRASVEERVEFVMREVRGGRHDA